MDISFSKLFPNVLSFTLFLTISFIILTILYFNNNNNSFAIENEHIKNGNEFNIIATADVGCSDRAKENIKNIEKLQPELFLVAGDLSYEETPDCWFNMTKTLDLKTKIAIGNHENYEQEGERGENLKNSYLDYYGLDTSYYSFDYQNVHVLVLDTQLELSVDTLVLTAIINETTNIDITKKELKDGKEDKSDLKSKDKEPLLERFPLIDLETFLNENSIDIEIPELEKLIEANAKVPSLDIDEKQYHFVLDDLEKTSQNKDIDWIIVMFHKPIYSSLSSHIQEYIMRDKYQPVFDKYGVDIVLQGHNHLYDRTLPLQFNPYNISNPIVDESNNTNKFFNPEGSIYSVIGLGGRSSYIILNQPNYVVKQYNDGFGFLNIDINGKELDAKYYDIGYKCKKEELKEDDLEEGDFTIFDMSSCKKDNKNKDSLEIIDHYTIHKVS